MCAVLEISPKTYYKYRYKEDPDYYDYLIIKEIFEAYKEEYNHIDEYDFIKKIFDNNNENEIYVDEDLILNQNDAEITSFSQDIFNSSDDDED